MSSTTPLLQRRKTQLGARLPQPQRYVPHASDVCRRFAKIYEADESLHYTTRWDDNYPRINVSLLQTIAHCFLAEVGLKLYGDDSDQRSSLGHFKNVIRGLQQDSSKELIKTLGVIAHLEKILLESKGTFETILGPMQAHFTQQFMTESPESCSSTMLVELDHVMIMMMMCCVPVTSVVPDESLYDALGVVWKSSDPPNWNYVAFRRVLACDDVPELLTGAFGQDIDWTSMSELCGTPGIGNFPLAPAWFEANTALAWSMGFYMRGVEKNNIDFDCWKFVYHQMLTSFSGMLETELDLIASMRTKAIAVGQTIVLSSFTWLVNNWDKITSHFEGDE